MPGSDAIPSDPDWCAECHCPIGLGSCDGCAAVGSIDGLAEEARCRHCGKELEDFSDLGCWRCDARHPAFGLE